MKLLKSKIFILILIVLLGAILRIYNLNKVPPGLTWDEASLGYNAYSILRTGRDEYGSFLPLTLKSFGDYKPALYTYLDVPFVAILGLSEWAVRMPSVLAGLGFILLTYLIIKEIFKEEKLALASAFFASISPVSIQFSRAGYESNIAVTLNLLGAYFLLRGLKNSKYFIVSAIAFILSLYSYQSSKLFVPVIVAAFLIFFRKTIKRDRFFWTGSGIFITFVIIVFSSTFIWGQSDRLQAQNFFAYPRTEEQINQISKEDGMPRGTAGFEIFHGEWFKYISGLLERYFIYFSPKTLFVDGDYSPRHSVPDLGILNYYGLILIPFGFYLLWMRKEDKRLLILIWLFTASIPAVLSRDLISMVRALNLIFPFAVLEGFGFIYLCAKLSRTFKIKESVFMALILSAVTVNLLIYLDYYTVHFPKENSQGWLYGYKQVIAQLPDNPAKYKNIIFSDEYGQPYIYYLFYKQYSPEKFQKQAVLEKTSVDVGTVRKIDNIEFRSIYWPKDRGLTDTLFIGSEEELPENDINSEAKSKKTAEVKFLDGETAFKIVENYE